MTTERDLQTNTLEAVRIRVTKVLPAQIRTCLDQLTDEQIWWRPNEQTNSVGNLTLHVCGAVMHFLCRGVGGHQYERDRPTEFATRSMAKDELLAKFDEMVRSTEQTFSALSPSDLSNPSSEPTYYSTIFEDLFGIAIHMAVHTGQIVYVTKLLQEGSLDELWLKTHRAAGAWRG